MAEKQKQTGEEQGKTLKRVRIKLYPDVEETLAIPKRGAPPRLGISDLDDVLVLRPR